MDKLCFVSRRENELDFSPPLHWARLKRRWIAVMYRFDLSKIERLHRSIFRSISIWNTLFKVEYMRVPASQVAGPIVASWRSQWLLIGLTLEGTSLLQTSKER